MMRVVFILLLLVALGGCAAPQMRQASPEEISEASYVHPGDSSLTLFTMVSNGRGSGGHSALMVSGAQRVIFDPAGSFAHDQLVERGDVLYGMTPGWVQAYRSAHAREAWHVVSQTVLLTTEQADRALALVQENGAVGPAFCTNATSRILSQLPGFEGIRPTFFPIRLMEQMAARPDVKTDRYYENDAGDVLDGVEDPTDQPIR